MLHNVTGMETVYLFAIGILSFTIVYIILQYRLSGMISEKMQKFYKDQMVNDMQEFYRELESYSAILESRILRLKNLVDRQEGSVREWNSIGLQLGKSKKTKEIQTFLELKQKEEKALWSEVELIKEELNRMRSGTSPQLRKVVSPAPPPPGVKKRVKSTPPKKAPAIKEDQDTSLAEELLSDFNAPDTFQRIGSPQRPTPKTSRPEPLPEQVNEPETKAEGVDKSLLNILSSIGKSISPMLGEKKQTESSLENPDESQVAKDNFKKMMQDKIPESTPAVAIEKTIRKNPTPVEVQHIEAPAVATPKAVKRLDPEELVKLIEKLGHSSQRPNALRSLLENGFSIDQISDLSKIPHSDLEMTRNIYNIE